MKVKAELSHTVQARTEQALEKEATALKKEKPKPEAETERPKLTHAL